MEDWVHRALAKWPNVPHLYGWLGLDRRGRWLIKDEIISRPQIIDTINRNYAADERGCWYFQNGPQRGYMALAYAPLVLWAQPDGALIAHTGVRVSEIRAAHLDQQGALLLATEHGPGLLDGEDLGWALERLHAGSAGADDADLAAALALPSGSATALQLRFEGNAVAVTRIDGEAMPQALRFVRTPEPPRQA